MMHTTSRAPETAPFAQRVASLVGVASAELGLRDEPAAIARELLALIEEPVGLFERHPAWPSRLTGTGQPVELSLKLERDAPALRWVVDVTDHRAGPAGNWTRYLTYASIATHGTGAETGELWRLCQRHLTGVPPAVGTRMMHGSGLAATGRSRGSLYFNTAWLPPEELALRFPRESGILTEVERLYRTPVTGVVDVFGYDYVAGAPLRTKAYVRPRADGAASFQEMAGRHPDLVPARVLFEALGGASTARGHPHPHLLQVSVDEGAVHQRLFFFGSAWGWDTPDGLDRLLGVLSGHLDVDLEPLSVLGDLAAAQRVPLRVAMIAVGACEDGTSVTFYLWPQPAGGTSGLEPALPTRRPPRARLRAAEVAHDRALSYAMACRDADGWWSDYDAVPVGGGASGHVVAAPPSTFVTAYVGSVLPATAAHDTTVRQLLHGYRPGIGWGFGGPRDADLETTALALAALARWGAPSPEGAHVALEGGWLPDGLNPAEEGDGDAVAPPEVTAAVLLALLESGCRRFATVVGAVFSLTGRQEPDGAWRSFWWSNDLLATWRALRALRAYHEHEFARSPLGHASGLAARTAVQRAMAFLTSVPVAAEPFPLALWLGSWVAAGGGVEEPRVQRVLAVLVERQQLDGRWLGGPHRRWTRSGSGELHIDRRCLITTATVVGALDALLAHHAS